VLSKSEACNGSRSRVWVVVPGNEAAAILHVCSTLWSSKSAICCTTLSGLRSHRRGSCVCFVPYITLHCNALKRESMSWLKSMKTFHLKYLSEVLSIPKNAH
jgi:hypothetical protein